MIKWLIKIVFSSVLSACSFYLFDQKEQVWFKVKGDSNLNVEIFKKKGDHCTSSSQLIKVAEKKENCRTKSRLQRAEFK